MKQFLAIIIFMATAFVANSQVGSFSTLTVSQRLYLAGHQVKGVTNSAETNTPDSLVSAAAVHAYVAAHGGGGGSSDFTIYQPASDLTVYTIPAANSFTILPDITGETGITLDVPDPTTPGQELLILNSNRVENELAWSFGTLLMKSPDDQMVLNINARSFYRFVSDGSFWQQVTVSPSHENIDQILKAGNGANDVSFFLNGTGIKFEIGTNSGDGARATMGRDGSGVSYFRLRNSAESGIGIITAENLTSTRNLALPDASGTFALNENTLPYTGSGIAVSGNSTFDAWLQTAKPAAGSSAAGGTFKIGQVLTGTGGIQYLEIEIDGVTYYAALSTSLP